MLRNFIQTTTLFLFIIAGFMYGNTIVDKNGFEIEGFIIDADSKNPVSYANVLLFESESKKQVNGIATNDDGYFELEDNKPGSYYVEVHFIGYEIKTIPNITISEEEKSFNMGDIIIQPDLMVTENIQVEATRSPITYQIDKKVINVDEQITATAGTAVEILENVPSVTVDIEGNVSLRGSSNFTVLIDGRPTIIDGSEVLQQIPSTSVETIEIITNPSAKYNPEGTAGIINLVMKKNKTLGYHALFEGNGGYRNRYGGQVLADYKTEKYQITLDAGYREYARYGDQVERNTTFLDGVSAFRNSDGSSDREGDRLRIRGELGIQLSTVDYLAFGGSFQDRENRSQADVAFSEFTNLAPEIINQSSKTYRTRGGKEYELYFNYDHKFAAKGHLIKAEANFESGDSDEETITELLNVNNSIENGIRTTEAGPDRELQVKIDYTLPLGKESKFEAGYQNELDYSEEITGYYDYNLTSSKYDFIDLFSNNVNYQRKEHALYSLYSSELGSFGYQMGFRAEYTDRNIEVVESNDRFVIDRWDYFPTLHSSYKFETGHQVMASYTRRIQRPRGWYLEPFETWVDAYNVRRGNPALKPEYIDSYEAGYQAVLGKAIVSTELYHRVNNNKVERLRSIYADNITLQTLENVGTDYSSGTELMVNFDPMQDWNVNLLGNLYNYRIEGTIFDEDFSRESFNWNIRFNNRVKLGPATQLQLNMSYNSASVSSQTKREGFIYTNLALKQDFFNKTLTATLQVRDLFGSVNYENISRGADFYTYQKYTQEWPQISLNVRYYLNKKNTGRDRNPDGGDFNGGEDF